LTDFQLALPPGELLLFAPRLKILPSFYGRSRDVDMATNFGVKFLPYLHSSHWRSETVWMIAVTMQAYYMPMIFVYCT